MRCWAATATISARPISPIPWTTTTTRPRFPTGPRSRCRSYRLPTGADSRCIRVATSRASSNRQRSKWLEVHGIEHWTHYYTDYGVDLQKRFFGYFLKGEKNGWNKQPRVQLNVRHPGEKFVIRHEDDWPIPRTQWTKFHLASD